MANYANVIHLPSDKVKEAVVNYCSGRTISAETILADLKYDSLNACWYFWHDKVYVGIELDGYLHT